MSSGPRACDDSIPPLTAATTTAAAKAAAAAVPQHLPLGCLAWPVCAGMSAISNLPLLLSHNRQDPSCRCTAHCLLFVVIIAFVSAWTFYILASRRTSSSSGGGDSQRRLNHLYGHGLMLVNTASSIVLYLTPMDMRDPDSGYKMTAAGAPYIMRCLVLAIMTAISNMAPKESLPALLGIVVPVHAVLDLLQHRQLCSLVAAAAAAAAVAASSGPIGELAVPLAAPLSPVLCSSFLFHLLQRALPLALATVFITLATHLLTSSRADRRDAAATAAAGASEGGWGCWAWWHQSNRRCMALMEVLLASRSAKTICWVSSFFCAAALVASQVNHIQRGEMADPLEVLLGLAAGIGCGIIKGQTILMALHHQLHDVSALLYDMVPKHVADSMLHDRSTGTSRHPSSTSAFPASAQPQGTRPSRTSSCRSALEHGSLSNHLSLAPTPPASPPTLGLLRPTGLGRDSVGLLRSSSGLTWLDGVSVSSEDAVLDDVLLLHAEDSGPGLEPNGVTRWDAPAALSFRIPCLPRQRVVVGQSATRPHGDPSSGLQPAYAARHDSCSVLFADIVSFTEICRQLDPKEVMDMLNQLYHHLDGLSLEMPVYKVETIGDCYMAATGLVHNDPLHAATMMKFAVAVLQQAKKVVNPLDGQPLRLRVGISSGPAFSGVVGRIRKRYCMFGDTVVEASRMESHGLPGAIHVSSSTHEELQRIQCDAPAAHTYLSQLVGRGGINVKGRGHSMTWLLSEEPSRE